jgi:DNA-binding MarR family transcriptional regulator
MNENRISTRKKRLTEKSFPTKITEEQIVDFFVENNQLDYTIVEVARAMGLVYNSLKYHIQRMEEEGTLIRIRQMGNGYTYQLSEWAEFIHSENRGRGKKGSV